MSVTTPAAAAVTDPCLVPQVRDVMVSQGLPTYGSVVRLKNLLVKYMLAAPTCAPSGAVIRITGGTVVSSLLPAASVALSASTQLPPIGPALTAPVPAAESDPLFTIPGHLVRSTSTGRVPFTLTADLQYTATVGSNVYEDTLRVTHRPDGTPVSAVLERPSNALRVLAVPFVNGGTEAAPNVANTQFPESERVKLAEAFAAVGRQLPVPELVTDLRSQVGGLRYALSGGTFDLAPYLVNGKYCSRGEQYTLQQTAMQLIRTNWNSVNQAAPADLAYGVIPQGLSRGPGTNDGDCYDGQAGVGAIGSTAAYGRLIASNRNGKISAGAIATMELLHNFGTVKTGDTEDGVVRSDGAFHSKNEQADRGTDRAWNLSSRTRIAADKSTMRYAYSGWDDQTTLLEKNDFDYALCRLTPAYSTTVCPDPGTLGRAAAGGGSSFYVTGSTDGTIGGTDAHTYLDDNPGGDPPSSNRSYLVVQRNAAGQAFATHGLPVAFTDEGHGAGGHVVTTRSTGTFAAQVPADPSTRWLEIWKGEPDAAESVLLHRRERTAPPEVLSSSVNGRTLSLSATGSVPANLRLDVFAQCPSGNHPVVNFLKPSTVVGSVALFTSRYDTSLACPNATLLYRVTDGHLTAERTDLTTQASSLLGTAAIHTPAAGADITAGRVITFTGEGRDAAGRTAADLQWTVTGPSYPPGKAIGSGQTAELVPDGALMPGEYTVSLKASDSNGTPLATATRLFMVLADSDLDGLPDVREAGSCQPAGAVSDPTNASLDPDGDGAPNVDDPQPCSSTSTAVVSFTPTSLNTGAQGNHIKARLTESTVNLLHLAAQDLSIVQVAGYRVSFPAQSFTAESASSGTAVFERTAFNAFLKAHGITGDAPLFVGNHVVGLKGGDPSAPHVFPS